MSKEEFIGDYHSEFAAPAHTILSVEHEGLTRLTTVILDGEIMKFETNEINWRAAADLADGQEGKNE